ncbi:MAG: ABC transporter permease [Rhodoferax sp.]|nr:ABC transporter permease [Rhodoferax sp.]
MGKLIARRLFDLAGVLLGVSVLVFLMIRLIPGDAAQVMLGASGDASASQVEQLRQQLGLNDPLPLQYYHWIAGMAQGDFGLSIWTGKPVLEDIAERIGVTVELTILSLLLAVLLSIPAGVLMAYFRGGTSDFVLRVVTITGVTMPAFWLGALLIFGWAIWFPNWQTLGSVPPFTEQPWAHIQRMFLPTLTCALPVIASLARIMRSAMIDALSQDYIRTARSKGLNEWTVTFKHALRNSLIPYVTSLGIMAGYLFSGAIVVEQVFAIPGLGRLMLGAIADRNYPLIQASILVVTCCFVVVNAIIDLLYRVIDKRAGASA